MTRASILVILLMVACSKAVETPNPADRPPSAEERRLRALIEGRDFISTEDLDAIKKRGVLRVLTRSDATGNFLYRGEQTGFQVELARIFAKELGVRVEFVVPESTREMIPWLLQGKADLVMTDLGPESPRAEAVRWTAPYLESDLVVVERSGTPPRTSLETLPEVLVHPEHAAVKRARDLGIKIRGARATLEPEDLLDVVASGDADAAIVLGRLARAELNYRPDLVVTRALEGEPIPSALGVRPNNPALLKVAERFVRAHRRGTVFNILKKRFFERSPERTLPAAAVKTGAPLTPFDPHFRRAGRQSGIDWRLLAAVAVQESRLDPKARSPMGARGLMQLMPSTAREVAVTDLEDPWQSIIGGARYLASLRADIEGAKTDADRLWFTLAAYNAGPGHVIDARALARSRGLDGDVWFGNAEKAMKLLAQRRFYKKARHGFARGGETVRYVSDVQSRFDVFVRVTQPRAHPDYDP